MTPRTHRVRRTFAAASVAFALVGGLASCAADPDIAADTAASYRAQVVTIAERAVAEDYAGALAELDALVAAVDAAAAAGELDAERAQQIRDAVQLVRADLDAAIAAAVPAPAPEPEPAPAPAPEPAPVDGGDDGDDDDDDDAPGNSGGKGKGKDKGDD